MAARGKHELPAVCREFGQITLQPQMVLTCHFNRHARGLHNVKGCGREHKRRVAQRMLRCNSYLVKSAQIKQQI